LNIHGDVDAPKQPKLGLNQQRVLKALEHFGTLWTDEAGALIHALRGKHSADDRCQFCAIDGRTVLGSLIRLGLAEKGSEGAVQLRQKPQERPQEIPY
jgi:hypothetical protein